MSEVEINKFLAGEELINTTNHSKMQRTCSSGFCFLGEKNTFNHNGTRENYTPLECYEFLSGIVSNEFLACFEVDKRYLKTSYGIYSDPLGHGPEKIILREYCTSRYSRQKFKLIFSIKLSEE